MKLAPEAMSCAKLIRTFSIVVQARTQKSSKLVLAASVLPALLLFVLKSELPNMQLLCGFASFFAYCDYYYFVSCMKLAAPLIEDYAWGAICNRMCETFLQPIWWPPVL